MADNKPISPKEHIAPEAAAPDMPGPAPGMNVKEEVAPEKAALHEKDEALPNLGDNVVSFAAAVAEGPGPDKADKPEKGMPTLETEKPKEAAKPRRGRPSKADKAAPAEAAPPKRDKTSQSRKTAEKTAPVKEAPPAPEPEQLPVPRDATRSSARPDGRAKN